jgi:beta-galactosidase/beta-glucuronidase
MVHAEFSLAAPMLWDSEHPNLHTLQVDLDGGKHVVAIRLGIR